MRVSERLGMPVADVVWMAVTALLAGLLVVTLAGCADDGSYGGGRITYERLDYDGANLGEAPVYEMTDHETGRTYLMVRGYGVVETSRPTDGPVVYDTPATEEASDGTH